MSVPTCSTCGHGETVQPQADKPAVVKCCLNPPSVGALLVPPAVMGGGPQISNWQARPVMQANDRCGQYRSAFQFTPVSAAVTKLTGQDPPGPGVVL